MDIVKHIKELLMQQNPQEKRSMLEELIQVLEYHHGLKEADIIEVIHLLLAATVQEKDLRIRKLFLDAISTAVTFHDLGKRIDWESLVLMLPSLGDTELPNALNILGFAGQVKYLPNVEKYAHHPDPEIREYAAEAIGSITSRPDDSDT